MVVVSFTSPQLPIFAFVITASTLASHPALCCNLFFHYGYITLYYVVVARFDEFIVPRLIH